MKLNDGINKIEKYDKKLNPDTATAEEIDKANLELIEYLKNSGDDLAAERVESLVNTQKTDDIIEKESKNPINEKLLRVNSQILDTLKKIEENQIDEQDTTVKSAAKENTKTVIEENKKSLSENYGDGLIPDFLLKGIGKKLKMLGGALLAKMFGTMLLKFTTKFNDLKSWVKDWLLEKWNWLLKKIGLDFFKKDKKLDTSKDKKLDTSKDKKLDTSKDKKLDKSKDKSKDELKDKSKDELKDKSKDKSSTKKTSIENTKKTTPKTSSVKTKPTSKGSTLLKPGKKVSSKVMNAVGKFAKFIPGIGLAIAVGTAAYSVADGYNNAGDILGIKETELSEKHKVAAGAGALLNDFSFGLVDAKSTAEKILDWANTSDAEKIVEKLVNKGIIETSWFGNNTIVDKERLLMEVTPKDLKELAKDEDWSKEQKTEILNIYNKKINILKSIGAKTGESTLSQKYTNEMINNTSVKNVNTEVVDDSVNNTSVKNVNNVNTEVVDDSVNNTSVKNVNNVNTEVNNTSVKNVNNKVVDGSVNNTFNNIKKVSESNKIKNNVNIKNVLIKQINALEMTKKTLINNYGEQGVIEYNNNYRQKEKFFKEKLKEITEIEKNTIEQKIVDSKNTIEIMNSDSDNSYMISELQSKIEKLENSMYVPADNVSPTKDIKEIITLENTQKLTDSVKSYDMRQVIQQQPNVNLTNINKTNKIEKEESIRLLNSFGK